MIIVFCHVPFILHAHTNVPHTRTYTHILVIHLRFKIPSCTLLLRWLTTHYQVNGNQLFEDLSDHEFETLPWTTIPNCKRDRRGAHILTRNFNFRSGKSRKRRPGHGPRRAIECPFQLRWMKEFSLVVLLFDVCHSFDRGWTRRCTWKGRSMCVIVVKT